MSNIKYRGICPNCKRQIVRKPSVSQRDNKTEICDECKTIESFNGYLKYFPNYGLK